VKFLLLFNIVGVNFYLLLNSISACLW